MSELGRLGIPLGARLFAVIIMAFPVGFLIFLGSTNFGWFTLTRQLYFLFGIVAGCVLGLFESKIVISKLANANEATIWQVMPLGAVLFGLPWLLVMAVFGVSEYAPFGLYAFFPAIVAVLAASGWYFHKFERQRKVRVFLFIYGFKYWLEPNPDVSDRFYYFLRDIASKDASLFWGHIGYCKLFAAELEKKQEIDPSVKKQIHEVLKIMNHYRVVVLSGFVLLMVSFFSLLLLFFGTAHGYIELNFEIGDILGPASGIIFACIAVLVFGAMWAFKKRISKALAAIDTVKLSSSS